MNVSAARQRDEQFKTIPPNAESKYPHNLAVSNVYIKRIYTLLIKILISKNVWKIGKLDRQ